MAGGTFLWSGLVKKHCLTSYYMGLFVTFRATHKLMRALEREGSPLVVIEE